MERLERVPVSQSVVWRMLALVGGTLGVFVASVAALGYPRGLALGIGIGGAVVVNGLKMILGARTLDVDFVVDGIKIGGQYVARDVVERVEVDPYPPMLRLELPGETLKLDVSSGDAERIRDHLLLAAEAPKVRRSFVALRSPVTNPSRAMRGRIASVLVALVVALGALRSVGPLACACVFAVVLAVATLAARSFAARTRVIVGRDGVLLRNGDVEKFVPLSALGALDLTIRRSERVAFRRVLESLRKLADTSHSAVVTEPGSLHASDPAAWIEALRRERNAPSYRVASVDDDTRWRVALDPSATTEQRAAAAIAVANDEAARVRLRVVANGVASPSLRAVIDAVTAEDDEALVEAVNALRDVARDE